MPEFKDFIFFWKLKVSSFKLCNKIMGSIFGNFQQKIMDCEWVKLSKLGCFTNFELNMLSDRVFSEESENLKIISIG